MMPGSVKPHADEAAGQVDHHSVNKQTLDLSANGAVSKFRASNAIHTASAATRLGQIGK